MAKLDAGTAGTSMTAAEAPRMKRVIFVLMGYLLSGTSSSRARRGDFERRRDIPTNLYEPSALLVSAAICNDAARVRRCGTERPHPFRAQGNKAGPAAI